MQIVEPIDIEDALRCDLGEVLKGVSCYATPAPDDLEPMSVAIKQLGGYAASPVSHGYDVSIDVWADTPGKALTLARKVQGIVVSLPIRAFSSGRDYKTAEARLPYNNPDPSRPLLPRCTFAAIIGIRGKTSID